MSIATYVVIGIQILLSLILIVVVLFQSGNQRGLSGSIAGGAETFFGKNKGRTIDAKLKKWTAVVAALFLISSICLGFMVDKDTKTETNDLTNVQQQVEQNVEGEEENVEAPVEGETENAENTENTENTAE